MSSSRELRLIRLRVEGYGRLRDFVFEPAAEPGTLIVAPNETGKSTLASAIFRGLFGFGDKSRENARRPWSGGPFATVQEWSCGEGETCEIRRDFDSQEVTVEWRVEGSLERRWEGRPNPRRRSSDRVEFEQELKRLLGFASPDIFRQIAFVGPGDTGVRPLAAELLRLLSGGERVDFRTAVAEFEAGYYDLTRAGLRDAAREAKQKPRRLEVLAARKAELSSRLADVLEAREVRREAEEELAEARRRRKELERQIEERGAAREAIDRMARIRGEIAAAEERWEELDRRVEQFVEWERRVRRRTAELEPLVRYLHLPEDFPERVERLRQRAEDRRAIVERGEAARRRAAESSGAAIPATAVSVGILLLALGPVLLPPAVAGPWSWGLVALGMTAIGWGAWRWWARRSERRRLLLRWTAAQAEATRIEGERRGIAEPLPFDPDGADLDAELDRYRRAQDLRKELDWLQESRATLGDRGAIERERHRLKEEKLDVLRLERRRLLEKHPYLELGPEYERQFLQDQERLERRRDRAEAEELRLRRRLADLPGSTEDPHRLRESIERIDEEAERLELERDAFRLAHLTLTACRDEFVRVMTRRLAGRIGHVFEGMTGARYHGVEIDPASLELSVHGEERRNVPAEELSRGTRDQLYFALRVSLLQELAADRALPIVLDDPFLHFDRQRLAQVEETLERLGANHQILLFTHDTRLAGWSFPKEWLPEIAGEVVAPSTD